MRKSERDVTITYRGRRRLERRTRLENNLNTEMQMASFIEGALGPPPNYKLIKVCPSIKYWF